ncbi:Uridine kinase [Saccharopolyspora antimicrobica]|uniref:Uridine kinase n=1 Tax=Saccharopolyspora antimicrobica TaxID=455193 RepID=A0A1I5ADV3_9PSEU|nr:(d)CMP kinase [Saccharopolyspora antimicrobica]RKT83181.1 uridine kinase [Saccharopolyspora antimicrobica]SFN60389.1 Uridine kinase [Saccharopolyspora antimicrobica]
MSVGPAVLDGLVRRAKAAPRLGTTRLVIIDGPAGSGKTTLADQLAEALSAQIVHMDDLYDGWNGMLAGVDRLGRQVLEPMAAGRDGRYQRYDWHAGEYAEWHDVPQAEHLIVEGCGAGARRFDGLSTLLVWVEDGEALRLTRTVARDGEGARDHLRAWMAAERAVYQAEGTARRADVRLDGWGAVTWPATGL